MDLFGMTDRGKVRKQNQDEFRAIWSETYQVALLIVCDGMGGAKAGNIASSLAATAFSDFVLERLGEIQDFPTAADVMTDAVLRANEIVYQKSTEDTQYSGMGTTLVAALVGNFGCAILNVGDSRAYRIGSVGIQQITNDHSVVAELVSSGKISLSQAHNHPNKNLITRAIGTSPSIEADVFPVELEDKELLLLCSDGLSNIVGDQELLYEILSHRELGQSCHALIELALSRGAPDNVTAVIYRN